MYNNIAIIYFSGTGNTAYIAKQLQRGFAAQNVACGLIPMEDISNRKTQLNWDAYDLIGLGYPVHAYDAPRLVFDFIATLPVGKTPYFLFKTAGNIFMNGGSTRKLRFHLAQKGWQIVHEAVYEMPANLGENRSQEFINQRVDKARSLATENVQQILCGQKVILPDSSAKRAMGWVNKLETHGAKKMSGMWKVSSACIKCGLCANHCPTGNISMLHGKISFGESCVMCLRCWWNCPTRALSHKLANPFLLKAPYRLEEV